jgi:hypothetical protein
LPKSTVASFRIGGLDDPPFADEQQLRIAAGALLPFFAADKNTDDEALPVIQAAYERLESIREGPEDEDAGSLDGRRLRRLQRQQLRDQEEDALREYIRAWRAWFQAHAAMG